MSEADAHQQQLSMQANITRLQEQLSQLHIDIIASQAQTCATSVELQESRSNADALQSEIVILNQHIAEANAKIAGVCVCVCACVDDCG